MEATAFLSCSVRFQTEVLLLLPLGMCLKESLQWTDSENRADVHLVTEGQLLFWDGILERNVKKKKKKNSGASLPTMLFLLLFGPHSVFIAW